MVKFNKIILKIKIILIGKKKTPWFTLPVIYISIEYYTNSIPRLSPSI